MPRVSRPRSSISHLASLALVSLAFAAQAATNDLDVARQALRDGFWSLARAHAQAAADAPAGTNACASAREAARKIVLESWARENKWDDLLKTISGWNNPTNDGGVYYRALALAKKGDSDAARTALSGTAPSDAVYVRLSARLAAELALKADEPKRAVEALERVPQLETDDRLLLAEAKSRLGDEKSAAKEWRAVLADTNAPVQAVATAAANLNDALRLRLLMTNSVPNDVRRFVRLRLGRILLNEAATLDEGSKLIREAVTESPDAEGAFDAFHALADAQLRHGQWKEASVVFSQILEIWPTAAREASVQEGYGWSLLKLGRSEEALQAFLKAEACAKTPDEHATASVRAADALLALGRIDDSTAKCREVIAKWPTAKVSKPLADVVRLRELEVKGRALYREFRFAEALKAFLEVAAGDASRRERMRYYEILCLYGQGRDAEAEKKARELAKSAEDRRLRAETALWLARSAYNSGRWREAGELFGVCADSGFLTAADAAAARVWSARAALADNDFNGAITNASKVVEGSAETPSLAEALIVQGEALIELARFDEAVLVFERAALVNGIPPAVRMEARIFRADALFAMGADNAARYEEALAAYRELNQAESVTEEMRLKLAYKIGLTLEKLRRRDEAIDQYYTHVVLAYREARLAGRRLNDESRAVFARAAFRLADVCEANGRFEQALKTLELVAESDAPAAGEAVRRIERIRKKGLLP